MYNIKPLEWKDGYASGAFVEFIVIHKEGFGVHLGIHYPDSQWDYGPHEWFADEDAAKDHAEEFNRKQLKHFLVPVETVTQ